MMFNYIKNEFSIQRKSPTLFDARPHSPVANKSGGSKQDLPSDRSAFSWTEYKLLFEPTSFRQIGIRQSNIAEWSGISIKTGECIEAIMGIYHLFYSVNSVVQYLHRTAILERNHRLSLEVVIPLKICKVIGVFLQDFSATFLSISFSYWPD